MGVQGPLFSQRFELQVIAPTSHYGQSAAVSPGSNFWPYEPYCALTVWAPDAEHQCSLQLLVECLQ